MRGRQFVEQEDHHQSSADKYMYFWVCKYYTQMIQSIFRLGTTSAICCFTKKEICIDHNLRTHCTFKMAFAKFLMSWKQGVGCLSKSRLNQFCDSTTRCNSVTLLRNIIQFINEFAIFQAQYQKNCAANFDASPTITRPVPVSFTTLFPDSKPKAPRKVQQIFGPV